MKKVTSFIILISFSLLSNAQDSFKKLDTMNIDIKYERTVFGIETNSKKTVHSYNGKFVTKEEYEYYEKMLEQNSIARCKPCYLRRYDGTTLISESVQFADSEIGLWKEFFPNGKLKVSGQFKEVSKEDLESLHFRTIKEGVWNFFSETGNLKYQEYWENNNFIKQVPEQDFAEIWHIILTLNGQLFKVSDSILIKDINKLKIVPLYKNKFQNSEDLKINLELSVEMKPIIEFSGNLNDISNFDIENKIANSKFTKTDQVRCSLYIRVSDTDYRYIPINLIW